jgi:hypothetical protein
MDFRWESALDFLIACRFKKSFHGLDQIRASFVDRVTLACHVELGTEGDIAVLLLLEDRREFIISHDGRVTFLAASTEFN